MKLLAGIEVFTTPKGVVMVQFPDGTISELTIKDRDLISAFATAIEDRYPVAWEALSKLYDSSSKNVIYFFFKRVNRFLRCNFGEYDFHRTDIDEDGMFNFEEVGCPLRGSGDCQLEGIICKPKLITKLTPREIEVVSMLAHGLIKEEIASILNISPCTVHNHRENAKARLQLRSTAQLTAYYYKHLKN